MKKFLTVLFSIIFILTLSTTVLSQTYLTTDPNESVTWTWDYENPATDLEGFYLYESLDSNSYTLGNGYYIGKNNDVDVLFDEDSSNDTIALEITLDPPLSEGYHYYVVTARDDQQNESGKSNEVKLLVDYTAPPQPLNLFTETSIINDPQLSPIVQWTKNNPPSDFAKYVVYVGGSTHNTIEINDVNIVSTPIGQLNEGTTNIFVIAVDKVGNKSVASNQINIVADYTSPVTPNNLRCLDLDIYIEF